MRVCPRDAALAAQIVCPMPEGVTKSWHHWAIRAGIARDISQGSWPQIAAGFGRRSHSVLISRYADWLEFDWPTRLAWLKLADEALLDIRLNRQQNAAQSCGAPAAWKPSNPVCAGLASGSLRHKPRRAFARGDGWLGNGVCAIQTAPSRRTNAKAFTTAQSDGCAA